MFNALTSILDSVAAVFYLSLCCRRADQETTPFRGAASGCILGVGQGDRRRGGRKGEKTNYHVYYRISRFKLLLRSTAIVAGSAQFETLGIPYMGISAAASPAVSHGVRIFRRYSVEVLLCDYKILQSRLLEVLSLARSCLALIIFR